MHLYEFHVHAILITGGFDENDIFLESSEYIGQPDLPISDTLHVWPGPKLPAHISAHTMVRIMMRLLDSNFDYGWVDSIVIGGWSPREVCYDTKNLIEDLIHFLTFMEYIFLLEIMRG